MKENKTSMKVAIVIQPILGVAQENVTPANGTDFKLHELQKIVGGLIEIVRLDTHNQQQEKDDIMVINEEGLLKDLQYNPIASAIARTEIVGTAIIMDNSMLK